MNREEVLALLQPYIRFSEATHETDNVQAYCPFHKGGQERSPSFYVYVGNPTDKKSVGSSFCHTCNEGWSLFGLLRKLKVSRNVLASAKQISSAPRAKKPPTVQLNTESLCTLPESLLGMFAYAPKKLLAEGFSKSILKHYEIGFDRERARITFPIRDHKGNLVALSGRTVLDEHPRYKIYRSEFKELVSNYSFNKKQVLWGLHKFYEERMTTLIDIPVVICEGFKAAMWVAQAGYPHVIALIGAFMSNEQRVLLSRVTNEVVLFLDNDDAGIKATARAMDALSGLTVRVANYNTTDPISPDDLSKEKVRTAIEFAIDPNRWRIENA